MNTKASWNITNIDANGATLVYGTGGYYGRAADDRHRCIRAARDGTARLTVTAPGSWDVEVDETFRNVRAAKMEVRP